jgi:hypothetical protein
LTRSEKLNTARLKAVLPADMAFLAMAQHRLGKGEAARQTLARLRQTAEDPRWARDPESQTFLQEAEKLLQAPAAAPGKGGTGVSRGARAPFRARWLQSEE